MEFLQVILIDAYRTSNIIQQTSWYIKDRYDVNLLIKMRMVNFSASNYLM